MNQKAIFHQDGGLVLRHGTTLVVEGNLDIGENVFFNCYAYISVKDNVKIGQSVRFGERVSIHDSDHVFEPIPLAETDRGRDLTSPIVIGDHVWVGANSVILRGAQIGVGSVIAAGSIVRGKIPAGVLAAGAPARVIRSLRKASDAPRAGAVYSESLNLENRDNSEHPT